MNYKFKTHFKGVIIPDPGVFPNHIWVDDTKIPKEVPEDFYDYLAAAEVGYYILDGYDLMFGLPWKDKKGRGVYTGEIIQFRFEDHMEPSGYSVCNNLVGFTGGRFCYKWEDKKRWNDLEPGDFKYAEVIGNVYQNPELLEEQHG